MAEALAILGSLSSVLQIADFTAKLVKHARELINSNTDALKDVTEMEQLAVEYENLAAIILRARPKNDANTPLTILRARSMQDNRTLNTTSLEDAVSAGARKNIIKSAEYCQQQAQDIMNLIEDLRMSAAASGWRRLTEGSQKALRFMKKKKVLEKRIKTLHYTGGVLRLALQSAAEERYGAISQTIMQSLIYEGFGQREQNIEEAYPQTYQWALDQEAFGIRTWLSSNSKIFWITGKPGSGKSTLMKFLYKNPQTMTYLRQWAQDSPLVVARFYFWYLGSAIQTSTEGLLRSILYQIIKELPELAPVAFPSHFDPKESVQSLELTYQDLIKALRKLAASAAHTDTRKKICFFIDGLDEFRGDYIELVDLLNDLSQRYSIKMLLSSRPWTIFSRAYEGIVPHLRLEDLTKSDIHLYVYNQILNASTSIQRLVENQSLNQHSEATALIDDIVERAEGVFLWVYLVVRDVRRGIAEGDAPSMLRCRVQSFPPDLNKFFRELIYNRVDQVYAAQTSQALLLAMLCAQETTKLTHLVSFLDYWLMLRSTSGFADGEFPYAWQPLKDSLTSAQLATAAQETRQFLSSACKDLLIMERPQVVDESTQVLFLHRTVYDFLRTHDMYSLLSARVPGCITSSWIFHLLAWSRLNLLHQRTASSVLNIVDAALGTFHEHITESYVEGMVGYIENFDLICEPDLGSEAIHTLAAYQMNALVKLWLDSRATAVGDCVATALLGKSNLRQFDFDLTDLKLLQMTVAKMFSIAEVHDIGEDEPSCCKTSWQSLLRMWCMEISSRTPSSPARLERLWEVAKMYILLGAPASQKFCTAPLQPDKSHFHQWVQAGDFLEDRVPPEFKAMVIACGPAPGPNDLPLRPILPLYSPPRSPTDDFSRPKSPTDDLF